MKIYCPVCRTLVPASDLNVEKDLAVCPNCQEAFSITALLGPVSARGFDLVRDAPPGAWFSEGVHGWTLRASTRSPLALFLIPFTCVWSIMTLGGIALLLLTGLLTQFLPFGIFLLLFSLPFVAGTAMLIALTLMTIVGQVIVSVEGDEGRVFQGIGPIGWTRRFVWSSITHVEEVTRFVNHGNTRMELALEGSTRLTFGSMLNEPRRYFLLQGLRTLLGRRSQMDARIIPLISGPLLAI